jgi:hypothetical protein
MAQPSSSDRLFYISLLPEQGPEECRREGCSRKRVGPGVLLCAPHHYQMVKARPCPWTDSYADLSAAEQEYLKRQRAKWETDESTCKAERQADLAKYERFVQADRERLETKAKREQLFVERQAAKLQSGNKSVKQCADCGKPCHWWQERCSECDAAASKTLRREQQVEMQATKEAATRRITSLLGEVLPNEQWMMFGVGLQSTPGTRALKAGGNLFGKMLLAPLGGLVGGPVSGMTAAPETRVMYILGVTEGGTLCLAKIGMAATILPQSVLAGRIDGRAAITVPLTSASVSRGKDGALALEGLPGGKKLLLAFPQCFVAGNMDIPERLVRLATSAGGTR